MTNNRQFITAKALVDLPLTLYGCGPLSLELVENILESLHNYNLPIPLIKLVDKSGPNVNTYQIKTLLESNGYMSEPLICKELPFARHQENLLITAASDPVVRHTLYLESKQKSYNIPNYFHQTSYISPSATLFEGVILFRNTYIGANSIIKSNCFINNEASIAHDSVLMESSVICPRVNISGKSTVGQSCFIATGAILDNNSVLGDRSKVSALSFYTKRGGKTDHIYMGNPAKGIPTLNKKDQS